MGSREAALNCVDWDTCPFTKDQIPEGVFKQNNLGNYFLTCSDGSYYYINLDGSIYHRNVPAGDSSDYFSPSGRQYSTPSKKDAAEGTYFFGIDWETKLEKTYFKDNHGRISLTLRSNVDRAEWTKRSNIYMDSCEDEKGNIYYYQVDEMGSYHGEDAIICGILVDIERAGGDEDNPPTPLETPPPSPRRNLFYDFARIKVLDEDPTGVDRSIPEASSASLPDDNAVKHGDIICNLPPCTQSSGQVRARNLESEDIRKVAERKMRRRRKLVARVRIVEQRA